MEQIGELINITGFAALVTAVVGLLKTVGAIKDGNTKHWVTGFNLVALVIMFAGSIGMFTIDWGTVDLGPLAAIVDALLNFVVLTGIGQALYKRVRGVLVIGKTFS